MDNHPQCSSFWDSNQTIQQGEIMTTAEQPFAPLPQFVIWKHKLVFKVLINTELIFIVINGK